MPFDWDVFLQILRIILRILQALPPDWDHREVSGLLADAVEANTTTPKP